MKRKTHKFEFRGKASDYFKIWIVNILLSILTLGIYSAWAKVRTQKYFYQNTWVMDNPFDYHANPLTILKGRVVLFVLVIISPASYIIFPELVLLFIIPIIFIIPWLIIHSIKFKYRNSYYRNIKFSFSGRYFEVTKIFLLLPFAAVCSGGVLLYYLISEMKKFIVNNSSCGAEKFKMIAESDQFFYLYTNANTISFFFVLVSNMIILLSYRLFE